MKFFCLGSSLLALLLSACTAENSKQAGTPIRIRWARDPETLDPLALPNQNAVDAANLLHQGLLQTDFQSGTYVPALADSLPRVRFIGDSLTQLDYHLQATATWDNGQPVLATDVAFTLKLINCPGLPNESAQAQFKFIRHLRPDPADPRHFTLICQGQAPDYPGASGDFPILPEAVLDPTHSLRQFSLKMLQHRADTASLAPVLLALARRYQQADVAHHPERLPGCGPYRLADWQANRYLTFIRKEKWWADRLRPVPLMLQARPQKLQFVILPDNAAATLALRRHELDLYPQMPARDFQRLQTSAAVRRELAFYSGDSHDVVYVGFNTKSPKLADKLTRQALRYLFDPAGLLAGTQLGQGHLTVGLVEPSSPFYNDSLPLPTYAPAKAAALLRRAGWQQVQGVWRQASGLTLALSVRYRIDETTYETVALQFRAAAAKLGIPVDLRPTEGSALTTALRQGNFDMFVRTLKGSPSPYNFVPILHSESGSENNFIGFGSPASDRLLETISMEGAPARKRRLLRRFQVLLAEEAPLVPLFFLPYRLVADYRLQHLMPSGLRPGYSVTTLTWAGASLPKAP